MTQLDTVLAIADNIRRLMQEREESQAVVAQRAGLSQRAVGDVLTYGKSHFKNPTVRTLDSLAGAYGVPTWMLLIPELPLDLIRGGQLAALLRNYVAVPAEARRNIDRVAEGELRYALGQQPVRKAS